MSTTTRSYGQNFSRMFIYTFMYIVSFVKTEPYVGEIYSIHCIYLLRFRYFEGLDQIYILKEKMESF